MLKEVRKTRQIAIIDLYTFTRNLGPDLYCDHVHFLEHIREKQARFLTNWPENT